MESVSRDVEDGGVVVSDHREHPLDQSKTTRVFHRAVAEAKLPSHVPYDCRHTFVCLMLMGGAKLGYVSTQIGHRTVVTTLRHYFRRVDNDEAIRCSPTSWNQRVER